MAELQIQYSYLDRQEMSNLKIKILIYLHKITGLGYTGEQNLKSVITSSPLPSIVRQEH